METVVNSASYILVHAPDMVIHNGTTQTSERLVNPESEYLKELKSHLRTYEDVLSYLPNQTYIGNIHPEELSKIEMPFYEKKSHVSDRFGKYGEIMPQDEFIGLIAICDVFDLVKLSPDFANEVLEKLSKHKLIEQWHLEKLSKTHVNDLAALISEEHAEPIYCNDKLVGVVKRAHVFDASLTSHVILENLVSKASCVLSVMHLMDKSNIAKEDIEYVIECSEEACGDMNQRGGGNFAKAVAEIAGLQRATGSDLRGFCAAPTHALINGSALVKAGAYKHVIVCAGGSTAKLGMNGKDHVKKGLPILEDCIGGFAVLLSQDDGVSPIVRMDSIGKHTVGTGSAPQNVISSLVTDPLDKLNLKVTDVCKYSVEMQNPDITKPAGAGNVPESNYKMIAALAVKRGDIGKDQMASFVENHGFTGWAPTQGHIPSGAPYVGFAKDDIVSGKIKRAMFVGKGSLFLGRMTNLFDGVSFLIETNSGKGSESSGVSETEIKKLIAKSLKDFAQSLSE